MQLRLTFDSVADLYDKARPTYPPALFEDLRTLTGFDTQGSVVEIGCGTGQASIPLARMSGKLVCVELGPRLAKVATQNLAPFPHAQVVNASFEDWNPQGETFDLVFCATAWHWLDPTRRYEKAYEVLKPSGHLAVVTNSHAFPTDFDPLFTDLDEVYREISDGKSEHGPRVTPDKLPDETSEILASGCFGEVQTRRYVWHVEYTGDEFVDLLSTYSDHIALSDDKRNHLFKEVRRLTAERKIRKHYLTILHVAKRDATSEFGPGKTPR